MYKKFICMYTSYVHTVHTCTMILYIRIYAHTSKSCTYIHTCTYRSAQKIYAGKNRNNSHSTLRYTD